MNASTSAVVAPQHWLEHFPIAIFSTVMGLAGLAIAWLKAHAVLGLPIEVGEGMRAAASGLFIVLVLVYAIKALCHPLAVGLDMRHPIRINFFPTISISLLLLAIAWLQAQPQIALWLWLSGAVLHLLLTLLIFSSWLHHTHYEIKHINPAWFIPVVGNVIVPVAGIHLAAMEISWFFFSIGLVFWVVLQTIVLYRLFFHEPLPVRLTPTLFILLAPPSVGFVAYDGLTGGIDTFSRILYYTALFLAFLLASNALRFLQTPFFISAWAYSFPLAALTIATLTMSTRLPDLLFQWLGIGFLGILTLVVAVLAGRTLIAMWYQEICVPE